MTETSGTALKKAETNGHDGHGVLVSTNALPISKRVANNGLIEEERELLKVEARVEGRYHGIRGYLRLFEITRVLATLSMYLYLDQFDVHKKQQIKHKKQRLQNSYRLTRLAVYGEKLYAVRLWFFQSFIEMLRRIVIGKVNNREAVHEKQAVWLKGRPTSGTRARRWGCRGAWHW